MSLIHSERDSDLESGAPDSSCSSLAFDRADAMIPEGIAMMPSPIINSRNVKKRPPGVTG